MTSAAFPRLVARALALCILTAVTVPAVAQLTDQRLQAMADYIAIEQLLMRYPIAFNTEDADAYVGTFAPDGEL